MNTTSEFQHFSNFPQKLTLLFLLLFLTATPLLLRPKFYTTLGFVYGVVVIIFYLLNSDFNSPCVRIFSPLLGLFIVTALFSGFPANGLEYSLVFASVLCLSICLPTRERMSDPRFAQHVGLGAIIFSLIQFPPLIIEYLNQIYIFDWVGLYRFPTGPFLNPNVLARYSGIMGLVILFTIKNRYVRFSIGLLCLSLTVSTGSRGAILALAITFILWLFSEFKFQLSPKQVSVLLFGMVLGFLLLLSSGNLNHLTDVQRLQFIPETMKILESNPLFGVGGWNFPLVYSQHSLDAWWQRHPHSFPLLILSEHGLLGAVVFGYVLYLLSTKSQMTYGGFLPALIFIGIHELVDTMFWIPGMIFITSILLVGYLPALRQNGIINSRKIHLGFGIIFAIVNIFALTETMTFNRATSFVRSGSLHKAENFLTDTNTATSNAHRAMIQYKTGDFLSALSLITSAIQLNNYDPYYRFIQLEIYKKLGYETHSKTVQTILKRMDPHNMIGVNPGRSTGNSPQKLDTKYRESNPSHQLKTHPYEALGYLHIIEKTLSAGQYSKALEQINMVHKLPKIRHTTVKRLLKLKLRCLRQLNKSNAVKHLNKRLHSLKLKTRSIRSQYHEFYYRRDGFDHLIQNTGIDNE